MSRILKHRILFVATLLIFAAIVPLHAQRTSAPIAPDSTLFTTYSLFSNGGQTTVDWLVCGSTQKSEGCYASGQLGPFVLVGAMLEGDPFIKGNVVTRAIYVVDSGSADVKLYVYKKVDTVTDSSDTVTVTLKHTVTLPLTGGSTASCSMAANKLFLFIGTDQSPQGVEVQKSNLNVIKVGGFSPPINVTAITSDQYGYVTVTQGTPGGESGFYLFGPDGFGREDGGGSDFVVGTRQAVPLTALGGATIRPASRIGYRARVSAQAEIK
jgi:hypothetical protein